MSWQDGLVGWWGFNDTLRDDSGAGLTLDPAFGTTGYVAGKFGQAANFTGANALRMIQSDETLANAMTSPSFTVSAWLKPASNHVGYALWMATGAQATASNQRVSLLSVNGQMQLWALGLTHTHTAFDDGVWHHYAMTATAGGSASFFINGLLASTQSGAAARTADNAAIGCRSNNVGFTSGSVFFQGQIDNAMIFNRALSSDEVAFLYSSVQERGPVARGLVGLWRLDGRLVDESGNGNDLTATGSPGYIEGKFGKASRLNDTATEQWHTLTTPHTFVVGSTFSAWINFNRTSTSPEYFLGKATDGTDLTGVRYNSTNFLINDGSAGPYVIVSWAKVNELVHFVLIRRGDTLYEFWINGEKIGEGNSATSNDLVFGVIGRRGSKTSVEPAKIDIQNAMIYNRALAAHEIRQLYALGSPVGVV